MIVATTTLKYPTSPSVSATAAPPYPGPSHPPAPSLSGSAPMAASLSLDSVPRGQNFLLASVLSYNCSCFLKN